MNLLILESQIVDLLEDLIAEKSQKTENIHLIGFSLGAQLCGIVGKTMKDAGKEVSRITGTIKRMYFFMKTYSGKFNFYHVYWYMNLRYLGWYDLNFLEKVFLARKSKSFLISASSFFLNLTLPMKVASKAEHSFNIKWWIYILFFCSLHLAVFDISLKISRYQGCTKNNRET